MIRRRPAQRVTCGICDVRLLADDGWHFCPCCGSTQSAKNGMPVRGHSKERETWCEHWEYMYLSVLARRAKYFEGAPVVTSADLVPVMEEQLPGQRVLDELN